LNSRINLLTFPVLNKTAEAIFNAAKAMSAALGDDKSQRFLAVLWNPLKLRDRGAGDYFAQRCDGLSRRADLTEGFARQTGACFVAGFKTRGFYPPPKME